MTKSTHITRPSQEISLTDSTSGSRTIATEVPLALCYNGVAHVVMMVTPDDINNFIIGFSITEGIIARSSDIEEITLEHDEQGIVANIEINKKLHDKLIKRRRNLVGQSGCGLCGVEAIDDAIRTYAPVGAPPRYSFEQFQSALTALDTIQPLHQQTGAVHGAAFLDTNAKITHIAEDVGRHNAFDKLIGALYNADSIIESGAVILTSRCSFELVQKALAIKLPLLVTISAPTDLALQIAKDHELTLITLARHDTIQVMNDPHGILSA